MFARPVKGLSSKLFAEISGKVMANYFWASGRSFRARCWQCILGHWEGFAANFAGKISAKYFWASGRAWQRSFRETRRQSAFEPVEGLGSKAVWQNFNKILLGQWEGLTGKSFGQTFGKVLVGQWDGLATKLSGKVCAKYFGAAKLSCKIWAKYFWASGRAWQQSFPLHRFVAKY